MLALGLALAWAAARPPAVRPASAPSDRFSAARALADVREIGRAPHPTGSADAERVRRYVAERLAAATGAPAAVRAGLGAAVSRRAPALLSAAAVQNVEATLPGRNPALPAVLVTAHYDSVPNSPGAADDGAGVAAMIEVARSLAADARAGRPAARDVVFLATDAEEAGLLGARAFWESDPLARHVGVVINMEARGDAGRAALYQTGPRDGALTALYGRVAQAPYATSFAAFVATLLPNDTDFTVALAHGRGGLNFAFLGDQLAYHTPLSTPAHLDPRSLQSLGGQVLPVVRALADAPTLPPPSAPRAYADLFGLGVVGHPAVAGGWTLWAIAAGLTAFAAVRARRLGLADGRGVGAGAAAAVLAVVTAAVVLSAAGALLGGGRDELRLYTLLGSYGAVLAGCALLALGAALAAYAALARARGRWAPSAWESWLGALATGLLVAFLVQATAPVAAPLALWPLLPAAAGAAAVFGAGANERLGRAALGVAGVLAVAATALTFGWAQGVFCALGPGLPAGLAPFVLLILPALAPCMRWTAGARPGPALAATALLAGAGLLLWAGTRDGSPARPRPTEAHLLVEPAAGRAWRVSDLPRLDGWSRAALAGGGPVRREPIREGGAPVWRSAVRVPDVPAPQAHAVWNSGRLIVTLRPNGPARALQAWLKSDGPLGDARLDARSLPWRLEAGRWSRLDDAAPPPEGVTLSFAAPSHGRLALAVLAVRDEPPPGAPPFPPVPPGRMAWRGSHTTQVLARTVVAW